MSMDAGKQPIKTGLTNAASQVNAAKLSPSQQKSKAAIDALAANIFSGKTISVSGNTQRAMNAASNL